MDSTTKCPVCGHPDLDAINAELGQNKGLDQLAKLYGVPQAQLRHHKHQHLRAIAVKIGYDPVTIVQKHLDVIASLELRMALDTDEANSVDTETFCRLAGEHRQRLNAVAQLTGAHVKPDWKVALPMWNRIEKTLLTLANELPDGVRERLYLMLEAAEKEAGG